MPIEKVGVVGCGLMGSGIAQVAAQAGCQVTVREVSPQLVDKGLQSIDKNLQRLVDKGTLSAADRDQIRGRLRGTTNLEDLKDSDLIIEAIIEQLPAKRELWTALDKICPKHTDFRQQHFLAFHHGNGDVHPASGPFPRPAFFQSGSGHETGRSDPHHRHRSKSVKKKPSLSPDAWAKTPVRTTDRTGFIVNRLLVPFLLDAIRALEEGVGSIEDIDNSMKLGCGHPMGPLDAARFRRPRHHLLHRQYHVRRIQGKAFRAPASAEAHGADGMEWPQGRTGILRLQRSRKTEADEVHLKAQPFALPVYQCR